MSSGPAPEHSPGRILIVDDDPLVRESLVRTLAADGHSIQTATNGREGLLAFEQGKFDLVILDYEMPDLKGDELAVLIKALAPTQPLIMITAFPDALQANLLTDVDIVVGKPFEVRALRAATARLLTPRVDPSTAATSSRPSDSLGNSHA